MKTKLTSANKGKGVFLPEEFLEALNISEGDEIALAVHNERLIIRSTESVDYQLEMLEAEVAEQEAEAEAEALEPLGISMLEDWVLPRHPLFESSMKHKTFESIKFDACDPDQLLEQFEQLKKDEQSKSSDKDLASRWGELNPLDYNLSVFYSETLADKKLMGVSARLRRPIAVRMINIEDKMLEELSSELDIIADRYYSDKECDADEDERQQALERFLNLEEKLGLRTNEVSNQIDMFEISNQWYWYVGLYL